MFACINPRSPLTPKQRETTAQTFACSLKLAVRGASLTTNGVRIIKFQIRAMLINISQSNLGRIIHSRSGLWLPSCAAIWVTRGRVMLMNNVVFSKKNVGEERVNCGPEMILRIQFCVRA